MPLDDYKAFLDLCKVAGVLSAKMGDFEVTFEPTMQAYEYVQEEEDAEEADPLFYSSEG